VHTSTVTVSVLDDVSDATVELDERDLRYRWFSGTGAGGQHRNKHQCCLELIHVPTGVSRTAQGRSRDTNARDARIELAKALSDATGTSLHRDRNAERSAQIGLGMRADKRRTYRFQDDRVIDHVTGRSAKTTAFMRGRIDLLWPAK
jgi:peptide chain release factor 1